MFDQKVSMDIHHYVYPVFATEGRGTIKDAPVGAVVLKNLEIYGTAFYLGNNVFMSAGHVIAAAAHRGNVSVGIAQHQNIKAITIDDYELLQDFDICIMHGKIPSNFSSLGFEVKKIDWRFESLPILAEIYTAGYPFSLTEEQGLVVRAFGGKIVTERTFLNYPARPWGYELSFSGMKGLSGSPLLAGEKIHGIIIENQDVEIPTGHEQEEVVTEGGTTTKYRTSYAVRLAGALTSASIAGVRFRILGGKTLREHVDK